MSDFDKALTEYRAGNYHNALREIEDHIRYEKSYARAITSQQYCLLGMTQYKLGNKIQAYANLACATAVNPFAVVDDAPVLVHRARFYYADKRYSDAQIDIVQHLEREPKNPNALVLYIKVLKQLGDVSLAANRAEFLIEKCSGVRNAALFMYLKSQGLTKMAEASMPKDTSFLEQANLKIQTGYNYGAALDLMTRAIDQSEKAMFYERRAFLHYYKNSPQNALDDIKRCETKLSNDEAKDPSFIASASELSLTITILRGRIAQDEGKIDDAMREFQIGYYHSAASVRIKLYLLLQLSKLIPKTQRETGKLQTIIAEQVPKLTTELAADKEKSAKEYLILAMALAQQGNYTIASATLIEMLNNYMPFAILPFYFRDFFQLLLTNELFKDFNLILHQDRGSEVKDQLLSMVARVNDKELEVNARYQMLARFTALGKMMYFQRGGEPPSCASGRLYLNFCHLQALKFKLKYISADTIMWLKIGLDFQLAFGFRGFDDNTGRLIECLNKMLTTPPDEKTKAVLERDVVLKTDWKQLEIDLNLYSFSCALQKFGLMGATTQVISYPEEIKKYTNFQF